MSDAMNQMLEESGVPVPMAPEIAPIYRIDAESRVPVSKHAGKMWKSRLDAANRVRKVHIESWDESIKYYNHSQMSHRDGMQNGQSANRYFATRRNNSWSETENLVYSNVMVSLPALYAKNPTVEFTSFGERHKKAVQALEAVTNALAQMKQSPGLNLDMHAELAVVGTELCNLSWMEVGYVQREKSVLGAQETLMQLSDELANAQDVKTLREIEGKIMALEEEIDVLDPPGPYVRMHSAHAIIPDANSRNPDFSDAKHIFICEFYPTAYLNAKYGEKDENGQYKSVYEPTAVINAASGNNEGEYSIDDLMANKSYKDYGYDDESSYNKALMTKCYRVWDKVTRRVYLYAANSWEWPIWVENDPFGLPNFYPLFPLYFNVSVNSAYARPNTTYYLDQQDAINEIHDEFRRERLASKDNVLFDSRLKRETVEAWLTGTGKQTAHGVDVPQDMSLKDAILEKPSAILKAQHLYDTQRLYASMDRVSGITDVMRGIQFKTNTTNKAIESYQSSTATRLDKKIDSIEKWLGQIMYAVAFMCGQFMSKEQVIELIGEERAEAFEQMDARTLRTMFNCQTVGGSTQKMTSDAKKAIALEQASLLAKFSDKAPVTTVTMIFKILEEAFDDFSVPADLWDGLRGEIEMAMQRGNSVQGAQGGGEGSPDPAAVSAEQLAVAVDSLPPAAKLALGEALAQGVPVATALPEVLRAVQQSGNEGV